MEINIIISVLWIPPTPFPVTITVPNLKLNREQVLCERVRRESFSSETGKTSKQTTWWDLSETYITNVRVHVVEKPQVHLQDFCFCMTQQIGKDCTGRDIGFFVLK